MKRFRNVVILLFAFALIVAACSSDDDGGSEETTTTAGETTETTEGTVDLAGTTVTLFGSESSDEEAGAQQDALNVFAEANGMTITFTGARDFSDQINAQAAGGNPPDIAVFPQPGKVIDFGTQGFILPIPQDLVDFSAAQWPAGTLETVEAGGQIWGLPNKTDLKSVVWYNTAIFEAGGYTVPTTLDDLLALGTQMIADGVTPWCVGIESAGATGWTFTDWMEDLTLRLQGADFYDQWVSNEIPFDDERVQAIGQTILDIWNTPGNTFAAGGSIAATAFGDNGVPLAEGDCAMHRQASFFAAFLPEGTTVGPGQQIDVFYFPSADDTTPVLTAGTYVSAFNDRPEVWAVMEYMTSAEYSTNRQAAQAARKGGGQSGYLSANLEQDLSVYNDLEKSFVEILQTADPARFDASDLMPAAVGAGTFWTEGTSAVNGDKTIAEAFAAIQASWPTE
ncbi:ABC transporter substrate-binding protein [Actinomycetota bacterium]|jgi:alpha-glucoside transport system substrate-binding protein